MAKRRMTDNTMVNQKDIQYDGQKKDRQYNRQKIAKE